MRVDTLTIGTSTDVDGKFRIRVKPGYAMLHISYIGLESITYRIPPQKPSALTLTLQPEAIQTEELVITGERRDKHVEQSAMSKMELEMVEVEQIPAFLGEVDILKTIQLLPGVQSAGDGNAGFYVRGGGPDQNLILLDGAPIYNASHLFGFFSVFNSDYVERIELTKGSMPARYGSRLASVLDVQTKVGDMNSFHGEGGLGLISSKLTLEGPIKKGRSSFLVSGRRTYADIVSRPFIPDTARFSNSGYYFYDINAKMSFKLRDNSLLDISGYLGRDVFDLKSRKNDDFSARIPWGNNVITANWTKVLSQKTNLKLTGIYTDYTFRFEAAQSGFELNLFSGIRDFAVKGEVTTIPHVNHQVKVGGDIIYHTFIPSSVSARSGDTRVDVGAINEMRGIETAGFIQDEFDLSTRIKINAGLRISSFTQLGAFTRYNETPTGSVDTTIYGPGEVVASYIGVEPRLNARIKLGLTDAIKFSLTRNFQYVHLANFSTLSLPTDLWLPSSDRVKPQIADQIAVGYFRNFFDNTLETSVELYYRHMDNMVEYREGALPADDVGTNSDASLVFGFGWSYGAEFFIKKKYGKWNGWIGYTWSKTMRKFEDLNNGKAYPAPFDRRHDLSIVNMYKLNQKWSFGATFVYGTGNAITLPVSRYVIENRVVDEYGERNAFRMAPYHRLDLSATSQGKKRERFQSSWNFAIYNAYSRANPFFIYFANEGNINEGELDVEARQVSLFPILPSVTYRFKF